MNKAAWLLALMTACSGGDDGGSVNGRTINGVNLPDREPDVTRTGDLSTGTTIDLSWADDSEIACFPGNENSNFNGNHVFFTEDRQGLEYAYIAVDPDSGVDTSFYVLQYSGAVGTPPDVGSPALCDAGYDASGDSNPGSADAAEIYGNGDWALEIGVAGANGETAGAFTVSIWYEAVEFDAE